jgi:hypothetical protein
LPDAPEARLRKKFSDAIRSTEIGGARVLSELSRLAHDCVDGVCPERDAVAFALFAVLGLHADDRDERVVTGNDNYALMASGSEPFSNAVDFIETGGSATKAIEIIASLSHLTPEKLRPK